VWLSDFVEKHEPEIVEAIRAIGVAAVGLGTIFATAWAIRAVKSIGNVIGVVKDLREGCKSATECAKSLGVAIECTGSKGIGWGAIASDGGLAARTAIAAQSADLSPEGLAARQTATTAAADQVSGGWFSKVFGAPQRLREKLFGAPAAGPMA